MTISRQEEFLETGRTNQKARTRLALVRAASELLREGEPPSMPDAAERAMVSVATAYRYFRTAEELWDEAAYDVSHLFDENELSRQIEDKGDDVEARVETLIREWAWVTLDHHVLARRSTKASIESWFAQHARGEEPHVARPRQRTRWNSLALEPLRGRVDDHHIDAMVEALSLVWGAEPVITYLDVLNLSPDAAKERMLSTARWIVRAGLAEAARREPSSASPRAETSVT